MATTASLERLVADFQDRLIPDVTRRSGSLHRLPGKADVLIGMRRSGKTWRMFQEIHDLLAAGVPREAILYAGIEDERLRPLAPTDLSELTEAWYRRFPANRERETHLFLDEVHEAPGWESFVRRVLDEGRARVTLAGSSAKLLSREIATSLRGRSLATQVLPFSFEEFARHRGLSVPATMPPPAALRSRLESAFREYLRIGGFPEVADVTDTQRALILQDYVAVVLFRDVVERHGVSNVEALRQFVRRLLATPGGRFSVHRLHRDLAAQGINVGKATLHEYLAHVEDAFLVFPVQIASASHQTRTVNPRKVYAIDPALARAHSYRAGDNVGHLLENVVYLELRRRGADLSYVSTASGFGVDFEATYATGEPELVQVCADVSEPQTREREVRALDEAMRERRVDRATVVTLVGEETIEVAGHEVRVVPAWRWCLERPQP